MTARAVIPFLVAMMLLTGVCNTLLTKYQDKICVRDCDTKKPKYFEQPVIQTLQMFIGEMGCWLIVGIYNISQRFKNRSSKPTEPSNNDPPHEPNGHTTTPTETDQLLNHSDEDEDEDPLSSSMVLPHDDREHMSGWKVAYLALPACCDIAGTTLMNVGLLFVAASIYQMTRGALVLFVGLFSVLFLKRRLYGYKWFALFVVVAGVAVVGLAGALAKQGKIKPEMMRFLVNDPEADPSLVVKTVIGVHLIAAAQIFTATQFVLEESIMERYSIEPLKAVGWEGIWGFLVTAIGMVLLHFVYGRTEVGKYGYFDAEEGFKEVFENPGIAISSLLIMVSIGGFNFFGLSVTRTVSATSRSTIDTCRTLFIWIVSLALGWETFKWLQVVGFVLLVYGTFLFNDLIRPPLKACLPAELEDEDD